jgi:hypothetical protein
MKKTIAAWRWSFGTVARSPALLLTLAGLVALWGFGAYEWLWLPESSLLLLLLGLIWGLAQVLVVVGILAATATSATAAAAANANRLGWRDFLGLDRRQFSRCLILAVIAGFLVLALLQVFRWSDDYALKVASFLTFRSERAVSPITIGKVFWVIQAWLWLVVWGFLLSFLTVLLRAGWREAGRQAARLLANCCWRVAFLTSLLSVVVFGGLAYLLAAWHPKVAVGFWDYAQMLVRLGAALPLLVIGWLFWMLSLARFSLPPSEGPSS